MSSSAVYILDLKGKVRFVVSRVDNYHLKQFFLLRLCHFGSIRTYTVREDILSNLIFFPFFIGYLTSLSVNLLADFFRLSLPEIIAAILTWGLLTNFYLC